MENLKTIDIKSLLNILEENKAMEIQHYHMPVDWIEDAIVLTATSSRHIDALLDKLNEMCLKKHVGKHADQSVNQRPHNKKLHIEGDSSSGWVIASSDGLIIHLFTQDMRNYYDLDELWEKIRKYK